MLIKNASLYLNRSFVHTDLLVENGRILRVGSAEGYEGACFDADGGKIVPGLIDVHTHGRAGYDFTACSEEALHVMAADYARHGVTTVMPTLASAPWQEMLTAFDSHEAEDSFNVIATALSKEVSRSRSVNISASSTRESAGLEVWALVSSLLLFSVSAFPHPVNTRTQRRQTDISFRFI